MPPHIHIMVQEAFYIPSTCAYVLALSTTSTQGEGFFLSRFSGFSACLRRGMWCFTGYCFLCSLTETFGFKQAHRNGCSASRKREQRREFHAESEKWIEILGSRQIALSLSLGINHLETLDIFRLYTLEWMDGWTDG